MLTAGELLHSETVIVERDWDEMKRETGTGSWVALYL